MRKLFVLVLLCSISFSHVFSYSFNSSKNYFVFCDNDLELENESLDLEIDFFDNTQLFDITENSISRYFLLSRKFIIIKSISFRNASFLDIPLLPPEV